MFPGHRPLPWHLQAQHSPAAHEWPKDICPAIQAHFLAQDHHSENVNELCEYLKGRRRQEDFFDDPDDLSKLRFPLEDLRTALTIADSEIAWHLDAVMHYLVDLAERPQNSMIIDPPNILVQGRSFDWGEFGPMQVSMMSRSKVIKHLQAAQKEIAYMMNELSRLKRYMGVNNKQISCGWGRKITYLPLPREKAEYVQDSKSNEEEDEDEEDSEAPTVRLFDTPARDTEMKEEDLEEAKSDPQPSKSGDKETKEKAVAEMETEDIVEAKRKTQLRELRPRWRNT